MCFLCYCALLAALVSREFVHLCIREFRLIAGGDLIRGIGIQELESLGVEQASSEGKAVDHNGVRYFVI